MARRIVLQEPESGLDVFLKELSRYASPQYQLSLREQERADARLELNRRQFEANEEARVNQRLRNQRIDELNQDKFDLDKEVFEQRKFKNAYDIGKSAVDEVLTGSYSDSLSASNMNIDSVLANVTDEKVRTRLRPYVKSYRDRAIRSEKLNESFMNRFNERRPDMQIDMDDARAFRQDPNLMRQYLKDTFIDRKPSISSDDEKRLNVALNRLTATEKKMDNLMSSQQYQMGRGTDKEQQELYDDLERRIQKLRDDASIYEADIARITYGGGMDLSDGFDGSGEQGGQGGQALAGNIFGSDEFGNPIMDNIAIRDDNYDIAFGTDREADEIIAENAIDTAMQNSTSNEDVALEEGERIETVDDTKETADELAEGVTEEDIKDMLTEAKEEGKKEEVDFLESALSGLGSLGAKTGLIYEKKEPEIEPVEAELFSNVRPTEPSGIRRQDGSFVNVESLSSSIGGSLKKIKTLKDRYKKAEGNSKLIIAKALSNEQSKLQELKPYISKEGTFSNKSFNDKFYERLSKRTNIPAQELKSLILFNMDYNI